MATDFINYRVLFQLHNLKHSKDNDLWQWFEEEVLPYVKRGAEPCLKELDELKKGPVKVKNLDGDDVYPTAELANSDLELRKKDYKYYKEYKRKLNSWNNWLKGFLSNITTKANKLIEDEFGYNFKIKLELKQKQFEVKENEFTFHNQKTLFSLTKYDGIDNPKIKKPHTFLNEAKWSAIGLSLRFSILDYKLYEADLKSLVIDDMLLSLDMRNRNIVLNLLLGKYSNDFQLILMTHDKSFFELAKNKIRFNGKTNIWNFIEMYENDTGNFSKPYFKPLKDNIQTAQDFLIQHDYAACGIYLRTEVETKLRGLLPEKLKKEEKTTDGVTRLIDKKLNDLIHAFKIFCSEENIDFTPFNDLKTYKDLLLNPLAHNDVDAPFFRDELTSLIKITKDLSNIKRGRFFYRNSGEMNFELTKEDGSFFNVRMKSAEQIVLLEEEGQPERISIYSKCKVSGTDNNGVITTKAEQFDTLIECYKEMCTRFGIEPSNDLSNVFKYGEKTFNERLIEVNGE